MKISSSPDSMGLGDILLLSSIVKFFPNEFIIQLLKEQERFSILFKGLANVEICEREDLQVLNDYGAGHYSRRKLRKFLGYAAEFADIRPLCLYSDRESEIWAGNYLRDKPNPVIVCPFVAKKWSNVRDIPLDTVKEIIWGAKLKNQTPIVVQSDSDIQWDCNTLNDLELKKLICLMRQTSNYVGANTGLYHLAVALGCLVECYQPEDGPLFASQEWCYFNHPTIKHYTWTTS